MTTPKKPASTNAASSTAVGAAGAPKFNLADAMALAQAAGLGKSSTSVAYKFTEQEGDAAVQNVFQQLLGRNAQGAEYKKALDVAMKQDPYTGASGRMQAVQNYVMSQPEYIAKTQDKWLDAIYNDIQKKIARARQ